MNFRGDTLRFFTRNSRMRECICREFERYDNPTKCKCPRNEYSIRGGWYSRCKSAASSFTCRLNSRSFEKCSALRQQRGFLPWKKKKILPQFFSRRDHVTEETRGRFSRVFFVRPKRLRTIICAQECLFHRMKFASE